LAGLEQPADGTTLGPEHPGLRVADRAGGVVYRSNNGVIEYVLVESSRKPNVWVLPKGHIEEGEDAAAAAAREVHEEAGVIGRVRDELREISYEVDAKPVEVRYYLIELIDQVEPPEPRRQQWLPFDAALKLASHDQTRMLLRMANQLITGMK
jgi:8-oxo-dGTP diphosphatase